jgi:curved DNA-binding protein CbpA
MRFGPEVFSVDLYGVLEVPPSASTDQIRRAYRRLVALSHPDLHASDRGAEARMSLINVAAGVLLHQDRRRAYDRLRASRAATGSPRQARYSAWTPGSASSTDWVSPRKPRRPRRQSAEVTALLGRLRGRPGRLFSAIDLELCTWPARRHGVVLMTCAVLAFSLVSSARPRSLAFLFAPQKVESPLTNPGQE